MNKFHGNLTGNGKHSGGGQADSKRSAPAMPMNEKTANWPGVPGKTQKSRSGGAPTMGKLGPFQVKKEGL